MASPSSSSAAPAAAIAVLLICCWLGGRCDASAVPAAYVFGDSLADVGNNNHLTLSLLKADFPHNGVDFAGHIATGRFSNGKNSADFLAEKLGLPTAPPYLSLKSSSTSNGTAAYLTGVNFASGGAGILDSTNKDQCISLNKQIDYYSSVYAGIVEQLGAAGAQSHLSSSIFAVVIGSNDILNYVRSSSSYKLKTPAQQFVSSMVSELREQLKKMYNLGARKIAAIGTGPIGCCPSQRLQNKTGGECSVEANYLSVEFIKGAKSLLQEMSSSTELDGMRYSFFDTYTALYEYINNPAAHGFVEVKAACCGLGDMNAKVACIPISTYCSNRKDHIFWDLYHPTEATAGLLTSSFFEGSMPYVYPINLQQLAALSD